jgi:hypothetical protein
MAWSAKSDEIAPTQCKAARALLEWSERELAARTHLPPFVVADFERNIRLVSAEAIAAMRFAFEDAGIEFVSEKGGARGVMLQTKQPAPFAGEGLLRAYDRPAGANSLQNQPPS